MTALAEKRTAFVIQEPASTYHARSAVSSSGTNLFIRSPRLYEARYVLGQKIDEDRDTNAMDIGTAAHGWVLEPEKTPDCVSIVPAELLDRAGHRTTKDYKTWAAAQNSNVILTEAEWDRVRAMRRALYAHPIASEMIQNATRRELSIIWRCQHTGLERKARLDLLTRWNGRDLIADIKTASDHSPEAIGRAMANFGYARQAAFYQEAGEVAGFGTRPFVFIVVRSKPAHVVRVYEPHPKAMELARRQLRVALFEIAGGYASGDWSESGENFISLVDLPTWARRVEE
jgi:hypothetical protein